MLTGKHAPLPALGDILWCHFPESERLGIPGPKPRPVLVVGRHAESYSVLIVYGTSQKTQNVYPTEFVVLADDEVTGLFYDTKFDMARRILVPFTQQWFSRAPVHPPLRPVPKMGVLPARYYQAMQDAYLRSKRQ
ncbi:type II toxin-antitoxin system PemK/MazF family toxin [Brenneria corticis]|uniref:Type II toxin-antitoxin system PemK/MazF family toxin n=1 Tax=Brenneria corticis TaxID=2173106 RepID=A0A2U1UD37_9GAMM|nr:type II toxin-antitoxin system PemK/MazF family toxin [Brenneria sp. CFCC 11842]PWC19527.1 hypothetical protein DDT56_00700 [Brenneria sp. CFCC 11842]